MTYYMPGGGYWKKYSWGRPRRKFKKMSVRYKKPNPYKLKRDIQKLKSGQVGKEWKSHDVNENGDFASAGSIFCLTKLAQGDTSLSREGLVVRLQSLKWKAYFRSNAADDNSAQVRCIIFFDTQQHGTDPTVAGDLLESASINAWKEHDQKGRYNIIYDKVFVLTPKITGNTVEVYPKGYKKCNRRVNYIGTAATEASAGKGNLYVCLITDSTTNVPAYRFMSRIRFTD